MLYERVHVYETMRRDWRDRATDYPYWQIGVHQFLINKSKAYAAQIEVTRSVIAQAIHVRDTSEFILAEELLKMRRQLEEFQDYKFREHLIAHLRDRINLFSKLMDMKAGIDWKEDNECKTSTNAD